MGLSMSELEKQLETALAALGSDNQRAFVREYLIDLNATAAAKRASYSEDSARQEGTRLLSNASIQEAVRAAKAIRAERTGITADRVLNEIAKLAFSDARRFSTWGPSGVSPIDSNTLSDDDAACVAEVSETVSKEGGSIRVKLHDKIGALDKLGKHLGLWDKTPPPQQTHVHLSEAFGDELKARLEALRAPKEPKGDE